jgi:2-dehydropantoate 2-reductase
MPDQPAAPTANLSSATKSPRRLSVLCFGAGAIGTYLGGSLALHGQRVVFLERPELAAVLRANGLKLTFPDGEHSIPEPRVAESVPEALQHGPFDVGLFAMKSYDTQAALQALLPYREALPPMLCLQNGVENEALIAAALGADRVIFGTVTSAIGRRGVGDVALEKLRGVGVALGHPLSRELADCLEAAGLNCRLFERAVDMKWSKMLTNLLANANSAILNLTPDEIFAQPGLFKLEVQQLREALGVMRARNIAVVDLPGTPVRGLALTVQRLPLTLARILLRKAVGGGRGAKMPSFHIDLYGGRGQSEVSFLNGAVVKYGEQSGLPTPVNRFLTATLTDLIEGRVSLDTYDHQPEKLLGEFQRKTQPADPTY